jgi:hypothetical protein
MLISIWHRTTDVGPLRPDLTVYTLRLTRAWGDDCDNLCDVCWTTAAEVESHHWRRTDPPDPRDEGVDFSDMEMQAEVLTMTFGEYVGRHCWEIRGMNPFFDLGRSEFLDKWRAHHRASAG